MLHKRVYKDIYPMYLKKTLIYKNEEKNHIPGQKALKREIVTWKDLFCG